MGTLQNERSPEEQYADLDNAGLARAAEAGLIVVVPSPVEVFVDLDTPEAIDAFPSRLDLLTRIVLGGVEPTVRFTTSKSGNQHAYVRLPMHVDDERRILIQALLGSDLNREILGLGRVLRGIEPATTFFEVQSLIASEEA